MATRLIVDGPGDAAWNMAVDEALLESTAARGEATLRLYQWSRPTLSLGYFQAAAERDAHAASRDCQWVRRPTGGGAILHHHDLTYCLVWPASPRQSLQGAYDAVHQSLVAALSGFQVDAELCADPAAAAPPPFLCFLRRAAGDVLAGPWKIAGSAQRRRRGAALQHGSVLLRRSPYAPELDGIADIAGKELSADALWARWLPLWEETHGPCWQGPLDAEETATAKRLVRERYAATAWNSKR